MTKDESLKLIDSKIIEKRRSIPNNELILDYIDLLFIRLTMVIENVGKSVEESFDKFTQEYKLRFSNITKEIQNLKEGLGYPVEK